MPSSNSTTQFCSIHDNLQNLTLSLQQPGMNGKQTAAQQHAIIIIITIIIYFYYHYLLYHWQIIHIDKAVNTRKT